MTRLGCAGVRLLTMLCLITPAAQAEDAPTAEQGAAVYDKYCATCHGDDLQNNGGGAFDLKRLHEQEHARFVNSVTHGKQAMPAWGGKLTNQQVDAVWAYVRANAYDAH